MKLLLVDDEPDARERLRRLILALEGDYEILGEVGEARAALALCREQAVDVVLLDIEMPGMSGLHLAEQLAQLRPPPAVILVTAYPEHALEAFEHRVQDYLVKPVRRERLETALARVAIPTRPQQGPDAAPKPEGRRYLTAIGRRGIESVPVSEVLYLRAEQKYVTVHHPGGCLLIEDSLRTLEREFPHRFLRIHRNTLVARARVRKLVRQREGGYGVHLDGCAEILPVSRRHLPEVRRWFRNPEPPPG